LDLRVRMLRARCARRGRAFAATAAPHDQCQPLRGVQTTDDNVTPLLIVSGRAAAKLEINASFGALGPGWRANATIGRALRLAMNTISAVDG
jgi:hypothetical protein